MDTQNETVIEVPVLETEAAAPVLVKPISKKKGPAREGRQVVEVEVASETVKVEKKTDTVAVPKYKCTMSPKPVFVTAEELRVPPLGVLKTKLGKELLSEEDLIANACLPKFTRYSDPENSLAARLAYIRAAKAKFEANEARREEFRSFAYELRTGEVVEYQGVEHIKCGQQREDGKWCNFVAPTSQFRFPMLETMIDQNPLTVKQLDEAGEVVLKDGKPVYIKKQNRYGETIKVVPDVRHALKRFACCPRCAEAFELTEDNSMDFETTVKVVTKAKQESDAQREAQRLKWERQNAQRNGGANGSQSRGFSMDDVVRDRTATTTRDRAGSSTRGRNPRRDSDRSDTKDYRDGGWDE